MKHTWLTLGVTATLVACGNAGPSKGSSSPTIVVNNGGSDLGTSTPDSGPVEVPETCGDGALQAPEQCDGDALDTTCEALGRGSGALSCDASCRFDTSACEIAMSCEEGSWCSGETAISCNADGMLSKTDCAASGDRCAGGACLNGCDAAQASGGSEGCQFVGAQFPNSQGGPDTEFVVTNGGSATATVSFESAAGATATETVNPGASVVFETDIDFDVVKITSDQPVNVVQFNAPDHGASQDSSLLFPKHAWGDSTHLVTWGGWEGAFWGAVSDADATHSTSDGSVTGGATEAAYAEFADDPSGLKIDSSQPSLVFGGHTCTSIITSYCDHLQHALFDDTRLGTEYHLGGVAFEGTSTPVAVQIVATAATSVSLSGASSETRSLAAGEAWTPEFEEGIESLSVSADSPVAVVQFIGTSRAPSMVALPHRGLWAKSYTVAGSPYADGEVQILAPTGAEVTADGTAVTQWTMRANGLQQASVPLPTGAVVQITSTEGVQAVVVGRRSYATFMHLAGFGPE